MEDLEKNNHTGVVIVDVVAAVAEVLAASEGADAAGVASAEAIMPSPRSFRYLNSFA